MSTAREIVFARSCRVIEPDISDEASLGGGGEQTDRAIWLFVLVAFTQTAISSSRKW